MPHLLRFALRVWDAMLSRGRNLWYRALGVRMDGYVWMRSVSISGNFRDIALGAGVALDEGVVLKTRGKFQPGRLQIGAGTYINCYTQIAAGERVEIGAHCLIGPHCFISDGVHTIAAGRLIADQSTEYKPVILEEGVWLGAGCIVLAGIRLGAGCIIGAGSVVSQDIPPGTIAVSGSARVIKKRE